MYKHKIFGYTIYPDNNDALRQVISKVIETKVAKCDWLACLNPHSYAMARKDIEFRNALLSADWLVPDGIGLVIASRLLGCRIDTRVTGFDVFFSVMEKLNETHGSVFFLGSTQETLEIISKKLSNDFPNVRLGGHYSPPFKAEFSEEDTAAMLSAIAVSNSDVLWVGLTAPKQEKWICENRHRLPVKFAGAIGAVFDFYAGTVKRSPSFFRNIGLEWLPRLVQQPRRLWRRTFVSVPIFLFDVAIEWTQLTFRKNK